MMKNYFKEITADRKLALTLAVILLILSGYFWYAVLLPQRDLISQLKDRCANSRQYVGQVSDFARERPDYENYLKELDKKLDGLQSMLPLAPAFSEFLQDLELSAREAGVAIIDIKPMTATVKSDWQELPLEIIVTGNFEEVLEFSKKMESSRRFVSVTLAALTRGDAAKDGQDTSEPELTGKISMVIYSFK